MSGLLPAPGVAGLGRGQLKAQKRPQEAAIRAFLGLPGVGEMQTGGCCESEVACSLPPQTVPTPGGFLVQPGWAGTARSVGPCLCPVLAVL